MKVALLIPERPSTSPALHLRSMECEARALFSLHRHGIEAVAFRDRRAFGHKPVMTLPERVEAARRMRNLLIEEYILPDTDITHVALIDSDVMYRDRMLVDLLRVSTCDIIAPKVMMEGYAGRFYDTAGFIEHYAHANLYPPHFEQTTPIIYMKCVGAFYIVPAEIFRLGATFWSPQPQYVEHWGICEFARCQRYEVLCDTRQEVYHVDLTKYGEVSH